MKALVDDVAKRHRVDDDRVYLAGISMGRFGTFDTLAPICAVATQSK